MLPTNYTPIITTGFDLVLKSYKYDAFLAQLTQTKTTLKVFP